MRTTQRAERATRFSRWGSLAVLGSLAAVLTAGPALAQPAPKAAEKKKAPPERKVLTAGDTPIYVTYYMSSEGKKAPAVVLLHMENSSRLVWDNSFAQRLNDQGYAVVTVDLRKHGQSAEAAPATATGRGRNTGLGKDDYQAMVVRDLEAVKNLLLEEHEQGNLNVRKTAIVAAGMSAPIAMAFAWNDWQKAPYDDHAVPAYKTPRGQDIRALVLLSPDESVSGVSSTNPVRGLGNPALRISLMVGFGKDDRLDRGQARRLFQRFSSPSGNDERMYLQEYDTRFRGTDLLGKQLRVEDHIQAFLKKHLTDLPDEWRTRRSRLHS